MKRAVGRNRCSKGEVITIDDDDSSSEQPAAKTKKMVAEPVPSPEVIELRQQKHKLEEKVIELENKLANSEKIAQGSCRIAGEAQARVNFLENLLDTKPNVVDGAMNKERDDELKKKVGDLTIELEEERLCRSRDHERLEFLKNELDKARVDRNEGLAAVSNQLVAARIETENEISKNIVLFRENDALKLEMAEMRRLALHDAGQLQLQRPPQMQQLQPQHAASALPSPPSIKRANPSEIAPKLHENARPTNFLQLYRPEASETLSLDSALKKLDEVMDKYGRKKVFKELRRQFDYGDYADFWCEVCRSAFSKIQDALDHFLSEGHIKKARAHGGAVSLAAFQHWFQNLPLEAAAASLATAIAPPKLHEIAHPTNIFQLCHPTTLETLSVDSALCQMQAPISYYGRNKLCTALFKKMVLDVNCSDLKCELCQMKIRRGGVHQHFLSRRHTKKVRFYGGAVSLAAFEHWFLPRKPTSAAPAAASNALPTAAAAAAAPDVGGAAKKLVMMEEEEREEGELPPSPMK